MSSPIKLSLLALISSAVAAPHNHFHHRRQYGYGGAGTGTGAPYPTGGWGSNSTAFPTGPTGTAVSSDLPDTTILETMYSTQTVYYTVYASKPAESAAAEDVSSAAPVCGPGGTITVTATNKVTVTVPAGGSSAVPTSSAAPVESSAAPSSAPPSSAAPVPSVSAPAEEYSSYVLPSSSPIEEAPVSSAAPVESSAEYSMLPITSEAPAPVTSAAPITSAAPVPSSSAVAEEASSVAPSSSAAPSPSSAPTYSGGKRGLAYNDAALLDAFSSGSFGFTYNWAQTGGDGNAPFIPMMHKPSDSTPEDWLANVDKAVQGGSTAVMGFNEPDIAAQANLSPQDACSKWVEYMNPVASAHPDVTILGPSVSNSGNEGQGLSWLSAFSSSCPDAIVHAANIHFYDIYEGALERFKAHIEKAAEQTGMSVWVTEFGLNPGSASEEQAAEFLQGAMEYMDGSDKVKGYAYFMVGNGACQLNTGSGLSTVGKVYVS